MNSSPLNIYLKTYLVDILVEIWAWATVSIKKKIYKAEKSVLGKTCWNINSPIFSEKWLINQASISIEISDFLDYLDDSQELHTRRRSVELIQQELDARRKSRQPSRR